jgi:hypothetical protein
VALLRTAAKLSRQADDRYLVPYLMLAHTFLALFHGRWRSTVDCADQALAAFRARCPGSHWEMTLLNLGAFWALYHLGELAELRRLPWRAWYAPSGS